MKPRPVTARGKLTARPTHNVGLMKDLCLMTVFFLALIGIIMGGISWHQSLQTEIVQFNKELANKKDEISRLKNDIKRVEIENEKRLSIEYITLKIREFNLALRPTEPNQVRFRSRPHRYNGNPDRTPGTYTVKLPHAIHP